MSGKIAILQGIEKVTFGNITGYATGTAGLPGVIVLQEWWGVTDEIQRQALFLASKGYRCIIPDLYKGKLGVDAEEAHHLMNNLNFPEAVGEIRQTAEYLKANGSKKVGVTGFCMGGALSLAAAVKSGGIIACAVPFYGVPDKKYFDYSTIKIPVLGHFGETDSMKGFSDPEAAKGLEAALKQAGCEHEINIYPGVGHAFMNGMVPEWREKKEKLGFGKHDQALVDKVWNKTFDFFTRHLH